MQVDQDDRIVGFEEKPDQPEDHPRRRRTLPGLHGDLRLHGPVPVRTAVPGRDRSEQRARFRTEYHSRRSSIRIASTRFPFATRIAKKMPIGAMSERSMPISKPIWIWWRIDPLLNMYDSRWPIRTYQPILPPPKFVFGSLGHVDRQGCASGQHRLPGMRRVGRPSGAEYSGTRQVRVNSYRPGSRLDTLSGCRHRAASQGAASDHRQGCLDPGRAWRSDTIWSRIEHAGSPSVLAAWS